MLHSVGFEGSKMLKEWLFEGDFYVDAYLFNVFVKSCRKIWWSQIFVVPLQPQMKNERLAIQFDLIGALVQLVRMPACHAGGHEFESRTHRRNLREVILGGFCFYTP